MANDDSQEPQEQTDDLQQLVEQEQQKALEYLRQLTYLQADFENYRKRTERQVQELTARSNDKLVSELLCVLDDLERALDCGKSSEGSSGLLEGVRMVHNNLIRMLEREGLERIDTLGKIFDPNVHEIVVRIPRNDCEEGLVLEEVRRGFVFKGRVLRPSMVNISCLKVEEKNNE